MNWSDRVNALRALGTVSARDYLPPSKDFRPPYRYVTVKVGGSVEQIAALSGEWILVAARVNGYVTVNINDADVQIQMAISRDLTEEEIASREVGVSFAVTQP